MITLSQILTVQCLDFVIWQGLENVEFSNNFNQNLCSFKLFLLDLAQKVDGYDHILIT